jgi:hypothetical protein
MSNPTKLGSTESYTGWFIDWIEEWSQFFEPCNWRTCRVFKWEIEDDRIMGGVETTLIVLGLGFRLRWNYARTEQVDQINAAMERISEDLGLSKPAPSQEIKE